MKYFIVLIIGLFGSAAVAENAGKVCFGKNNAKIAHEHTDSLFITVGDSRKLFFNQKYVGAALYNLNLDQDHLVQIYLDGAKSTSWVLNFNDLKTDAVIITRSAGAWRMDPITADECK